MCNFLLLIYINWMTAVSRADNNCSPIKSGDEWWTYAFSQPRIWQLVALSVQVHINTHNFFIEISIFTIIWGANSDLLERRINVELIITHKMYSIVRRRELPLSRKSAQNLDLERKKLFEFTRGFPVFPLDFPPTSASMRNDDYLSKVD